MSAAFRYERSGQLSRILSRIENRLKRDFWDNLILGVAGDLGVPYRVGSCAGAAG